MPCYSSITRTQMTDASRLRDALDVNAWTITLDGEHSMTARKDGAVLDFSRRNEKEPFSTSSTNLEALRAVQRKYTELTVRELARRRGFTIQSEQTEGGMRLTLTNRREK